MRKYRLTSAALSELKEATLYYEEKENGLGTAFLDEIGATVERIQRFPLAWHTVSPRIRRCRTHRFPFGLLYQIRPDEILITAVNGSTSAIRNDARSLCESPTPFEANLTSRSASPIIIMQTGGDRLRQGFLATDGCHAEHL